MESLQINTSEKRIAINGDPNRVIVFNPNDVAFAERFYRLIDELRGKVAEYKVRSEKLEASQEVDAQGIPLNLSDRLTFANEACEFMREQIDRVFGAGTSQTAFGDTRELDMFGQFLNGLTPFIKNARSAKIETYTNKRPKRGKK